ncbi:DNA cytosine methyltransferase [Pseudanabaena galeata UHCC 0370]|uniref:Cytosine-specific methyltransferase n=1 Tax=Pseudanabaena galeata UHCC 0370 TaxID=3110310 RepID=A0ABU5TRE4_9CYAN|nr:DNA cytosine methyltransferase [Pseudanabaena galeata]MEA5480621.1 DNA cytosine methyltransferase [Pseudanabaena galeata UHCC 0370]
MGNQRPIAVDLFAGVGGMTLGFEQAGFDVLASVEIDPIHCATHEYNFPMWAAICASVTEISGDDIRQRSKIGDREVDVVFGGPPCQGFSMMGKRAFDDPRNQLVSHFMRLVKELNANYFVMENVKGLTLGNHRQFLDEVIENFKANGYEILSPYKVLDASHFGVPQHRERLFLIGCRQGLPLPNYPSPITKPAKAKRIAKELANLPDSPTVKDAIADLPDISQYPELMKQDNLQVEFGEFSEYVKLINNLGKSHFSYKREYDKKLLTSSLMSKHQATSIKRFSDTVQGEVEIISRFYKLALDGISNTLRAGTPSNRGAFTAPRPIHPITPRCITVREAARLHSYPDWFCFHRTIWHGFRQVGNSVPPMLAKAVASQIIKTMNVSPTLSEKILSMGERPLLEFNMTKASQYYKVSPYTIEQRTKKMFIKN